ncbi:MAG: hypothetical protein J5671_07715 [Bacteroidaceae bacterium]|nr:hypothetical protein [Bacteroidaceae bacterium]
MKKTIQLIALAAIALVATSSCKTSLTAGGTSAAEIIDSYTGSINDVNLEIASEPITYNIDISTTEGQLKLKNLSLTQAKSLALREAVMTNRCAKIVNPQYTHLMKGKQVLRITVYGFPAVYKNAKE